MATTHLVPDQVSMNDGGGVPRGVLLLCSGLTVNQNHKFHSETAGENYYRTRAIISLGLYIFYPIFHCGLYSKAVNITDNLCTKQGNSSKKSVVYNQERFQIKSGL